MASGDRFIIGIGSYLDTMPYKKDSRVRGTDGDIYKSKDDDNLDNDLSDTDYWINESAIIRANTKAGMPIGCIVMWSGKVSEIPENWALCDGDNGTPDLVDRFVYGTDNDDNVGDIGGSADAIIVSHNHNAKHGHDASSNSTGDHKHKLLGATGDDGYNGLLNGSDIKGIMGNDTSSKLDYNSGSGDQLTSNEASHSHTITVDDEDFNTATTGESGTNKNLPPYMKLAYIMKVA
jgi:hypothetical protein